MGLICNNLIVPGEYLIVPGEYLVFRGKYLEFVNILVVYNKKSIPQLGGMAAAISELGMNFIKLSANSTRVFGVGRNFLYLYVLKIFIFYTNFVF